MATETTYTVNFQPEHETLMKLCIKIMEGACEDKVKENALFSRVLNMIAERINSGGVDANIPNPRDYIDEPTDGMADEAEVMTWLSAVVAHLRRRESGLYRSGGG